MAEIELEPRMEHARRGGGVRRSRGDAQWDGGTSWRWSTSWVSALRIFIATRVLASLVGALAFTTFPSQKTLPVVGYSGVTFGAPWDLIFGIWERSDALWYLHIARDGYSGGQDAAFFPLYPWLVRALHLALPLPWPVVGILVSNAALLAGLVLVHRLVSRLWDEALAERALWILALSPGAVFFFAPYTESLFLALSAAAFLLASQRRWFLAGVCGFFLALTRNWGAAICLPFMFEGLFGVRQGDGARLSRWRWIGAVAITLAAPALWMGYWDAKSGDALAFIHQQGGWQRDFRLPWVTVRDGLAQAATYWGTPPGGIYLFDALVVVGALILAIVGFFLLPFGMALWPWLGLLPALCAPFSGRMLMSCTRFETVLFPLAITAAAVGSPAFQRGARAVLAGLFALATALYVCNQNMF